MYPYRNGYPGPDQRFLGWGFGLPFLGGLLGAGLGVGLFARPFYGGFGGFGYGGGIGYPGIGYPGIGFPGMAYGAYPPFY